MEPSQEHPIRRYRAGKAAAASDEIVTEARVELDVNDGEASVAMLCLPQDLEAMAVGFLLGEGVLRRREDLRSVKVSDSGSKVCVSGDFDAEALETLQRRWTWGTGCGAGGTSRDMDSPAYRPVGPGLTLTADMLVGLAGDFYRGTVLWRATGGVHACALADAEHIILRAEDIGRHNAFDKIIGAATLGGVDVSDKLVLSTGRLSAEIVSKAVACGVPMLVSRSAVTSLAVDLAKRFAVTLVGFVRAGRMNVYTGYDRIAAGDEPAQESES